MRVFKGLKKAIFPILLSAAALVSLANGASAYQIQDLPDTEVKGDVVLGPTKIELFLDPGEKATKEIMVTNRTGKDVNFVFDVEDFKGSYNPDQTIIFLGKETGPYSLKDWLKPELNKFTLKHGQRIILPVEVSIPLDADPGGHYGVVFAVVQPPESGPKEGGEAASGQVAVVSRAGTLFFVKVNGKINEDGKMTGLRVAKNFYEQGPIALNVSFENNGSVHLTPYGAIEIKNILGRTVGEVELDPWFVMPDSLRNREVTWEKGFLFGKYTALATINRGYGDIIDQESVSFWVIPWKIVLAGLVALFLVVWFFYWVFSKFEFKRKEK
jgi:hypothetical protein